MSETNYMQEAMQLFMERFRPAPDIASATDFISTKEIHTALKEHHPGMKIESTEIFDLMKENGYLYAPDPGRFRFALRWMVIRQPG